MTTSSQYLFTPLGSNSTTSISCFGSSAQNLFNSTTPLAKSNSPRCFGLEARGPGLHSLGQSFRSLSLAAAARSSDNNSDAFGFGWSPCPPCAPDTQLTPLPQPSPSSTNSFLPSASVQNQHSINDDITGELDGNLTFLTDAETERHGGFGFDYYYYGVTGTATRRTNAAVAVPSSLNHYHHQDLKRAQQTKIYEPFSWMIDIIRDMATQLNILLKRGASSKYLVVVSWKDIVGDKRKKTTNGSKKIAAIDLLASSDTARGLCLTHDQMAILVKKVQEWIKYYRRRAKKDKLLGWQRLLLSDLERTHGIQIL